ncbi:hypothetical protein QOZ80_9BG0710080 [Eleusine coracana subsp. coracana]|nr:hypothetical protein QOZ80_9BG0710080 [Eleusine coracana subsp. coracana]
MKQFSSGLPHEYYYYYCGLCLFLGILVHAVLRTKSGGSKNPDPNLPPGPWQLPILGSFHHLLHGVPHHTMRDLSHQYGPLMMFKVCERIVVVVSTAEVAREVFKGHDTAFEQRPTSPVLDELHSGHGQGVALAPYGEHWRQLRRIIVTQVLSPRCVQAYRRIRQDEAARLISKVASTPPGQLVNVSTLIAEFITDSAMRAILGDMLPDRAKFLKMMKHVMEFSSVFDLRDLFPSSRLLQMLPRSHKAQWLLDGVFQLMDDILQRHEERRGTGPGNGEQEQNMIDVLLRIQKADGALGGSLTPGVIKAVLMDVFGAAVDTQTISLQWAMAELAANPRVMNKAQEEIRRVLAGKERVQEEDLTDLRYLRAVIKETLRLHPPTALVPRVCLQENKKVQGYDVPHGTILVTNVWAISRDPKYWKDPDSFIPENSFIPERFENEGVKPEELDMTEVFGITVKRKADLLLHSIPWIPE